MSKYKIISKEEYKQTQHNENIKYLNTIRHKDKILKEKIWLDNNKKCPVLNEEVEIEYIALDHLHKNRKSDIPNLENGGVIRGPISTEVNVILGKIENSFKRTGLSKYGYNIPDILRGLANYLEQGPYQDEDGNYYVHPSEVIKPSKLMKDSYSKLLKALKNINYPNKIPEYPKSGCLTQPLEKLYDLVNLEPEYYKQ